MGLTLGMNVLVKLTFACPCGINIWNVLVELIFKMHVAWGIWNEWSIWDITPCMT